MTNIIIIIIIIILFLYLVVNGVNFMLCVKINKMKKKERKNSNSKLEIAGSLWQKLKVIHLWDHCRYLETFGSDAFPSVV